MPKAKNNSDICKECRWFRGLHRRHMYDQEDTPDLIYVWFENCIDNTHLGTCSNVHSEECGRVLVSTCPVCDEFDNK